MSPEILKIKLGFASFEFKNNEKAIISTLKTKIIDLEKEVK
jgi:hypothetical protein